MFVSFYIFLVFEEKNEDFLHEAKNWKNADYDKNKFLDQNEFIVFLHPEHNKRVIEIMADELIAPLDVDKDGVRRNCFLIIIGNCYFQFSI